VYDVNRAKLVDSLPLDIPGPALFNREDFKHKVVSLGPGIYDETFEFNPQSSSQWDGFRHVRA
jgi:hypothetical protein